MAIDGKEWSATLIHGYNGGFYSYLLYDSFRTSPEQLVSMYPTLTYDYVASQAMIEQRNLYRQSLDLDGNPYEPTGTQAEQDEAAMLDEAWWKHDDDGGAGTLEASFPLATDSFTGEWILSSALYGMPSSVYAMLPTNPVFAETTPTPFGSFGNGSIHHSLMWSDGVYNDVISDTGQAFGATFGITSLDVTFFFTPTEGGLPVPPPEFPEESAPADEATLRCWTFSLDGHDFYVLRLGASETLVYDLTTDQWCSWKTTGRENWRAHVGQNWVGMRDTLNTYSTDIVSGDDVEGLLWILAPELGQDDNTAGDGVEFYPCVVAGGIALNGHETVPCNALTLCLSLGAPMLDGAVISLRTSDDYGNTWIEHGSVAIDSGAYDQFVEWYSLGLMGQPGRIFEITDSGASVRIGRAEIR